MNAPPYRASAPRPEPAPVAFTGRDTSTPLWLVLLMLASCGLWFWALPGVFAGALVVASAVDHWSRRFRLVVASDGYHLTRYRLGFVPVSWRRVPLDHDVTQYVCPEDVESQGLTWGGYYPGGDAEVLFGPPGDGPEVLALVRDIRAAADAMRAHAGAPATRARA